MMKVLVADDDFSTRKILKKHLKAWGYEVILAENGADAWKLLQQDGVCLALLDWMMPQAEGIELCKKIREKENSNYKYIILLTSRDYQGDIIRGLEAGADDYMTKPFNPFELRLRLHAGRRIIELEQKLLEAQEKLLCLATEDSLTGLLNRATILQRLEEELARSLREGFFVGVILVDVDFFKKINDSYGHDVGDSVLVEIACRLRKTVRSYDCIGRYGGDEILVVLSRCDTERLNRVADRIRSSVCRKRIKTEEELLKVTISTGGASSEGLPRTSPEDLIRASDKALYKAKSKGRNHSVVACSSFFD